MGRRDRGGEESQREREEEEGVVRKKDYEDPAEGDEGMVERRRRNEKGMHEWKKEEKELNLW